MTRHFCTYFDSRFLARGLALHRSLLRHAAPFVLHVLCLDSQAYESLLRLKAAGQLPGVEPLRLADLEAACPALVKARGNRSLVEYYFTLSPALPRFLLHRDPSLDAVTYLDSDLYFFSDPQPVFDEFAKGSVLIIEHRHPPENRALEKFGRFNVGWISFRNDSAGNACLEDWHARCLDWCYERLEDDRYADQKYLDAWPSRFPGVIVCPHPGANLAPWNLPRHRVTVNADEVFADGRPLIFYHFHRLRVIRPWLYAPGLEKYSGPAGREMGLVRQYIYRPYLRELSRLLRQRGVTPSGNLRIAGSQSRRELLRWLIQGRTIVSAGPLAMPLHVEPLARPFLRLRQWAVDSLAPDRDAA